MLPVPWHVFRWDPQSLRNAYSRWGRCEHSRIEHIRTVADLLIMIVLICLGSLGATLRHFQLVHCVFRRGSLARGSPNRVLFMICMNIMRTRQLIACITTPDIDAREQNHRERVLNGAVPARVRSSSTACVNKHTCTHTRMQRHSNTGTFLSCMAPKGTVAASQRL